MHLIFRDTARQAAGGNERRASSVWNASLPKPQLFSNIFFQDQLPSSSGSAQQGAPPNSSSGPSPPKKTRNEASVEKTEAFRAQPTPPEPAPPPPPPETSPIETDQPPPPPLPPPKESVTVPPSNDYYTTNVTGTQRALYLSLKDFVKNPGHRGLPVVRLTWSPVADGSCPAVVVKTHHVSGPPDITQLGVSGSLPDLRLLAQSGTRIPASFENSFAS
ncbi:hypothetical protein ANCDUO_04353 [Ancylostoma duodenale]|uniref:Uncharacterized protein n=1 Tax=Ancylostoma duodenale TaxID=51022 RepID=A0A0C2GV63_9BILA|nr:hypothetical protein ANCDUO_04353 [Ancylostoma duodenale]